MAEHSPEQVRGHLKHYWMIYIALMVLTGITIGISYLSVSVGLAIFIALVVATIKGSLVARDFMHLKGEKKIIMLSLVLTIFFFAVLLLIPVMTSLDRLGGK